MPSSHHHSMVMLKSTLHIICNYTSAVGFGETRKCEPISLCVFLIDIAYSFTLRRGYSPAMQGSCYNVK